MHRDTNMRESSSRRVAAVGLLLAALGLAGCGKSRQDTTPPPDVNPAWVTTIRKNAAKVTAGDAASGQTWDGWGHLKGRIVVTGAVPSPREIAVTANPEYCEPFKAEGKLRNEAIVVSAKNELKNVALWVATKGVPAHESYAGSAKDFVELDNRGCRFEPHVQLLRTSQTLLVTNTDTVGHNTKYDSLSQPFNAILPVGGKTPKQLTIEERKPTGYSCDVHKWMNGYLVLRASPYMAKTADDGSFEIKYLPAGGTLEIEVWHERLTTGVPGAVKNVQGTKSVTLDKPGRLTVVILKDGEASFTLEVPASALGGS